jgi:hypothetical protein
VFRAIAGRIGILLRIVLRADTRARARRITAVSPTDNAQNVRALSVGLFWLVAEVEKGYANNLAALHALFQHLVSDQFDESACIAALKLGVHVVNNMFDSAPRSRARIR